MLVDEKVLAGVEYICSSSMLNNLPSTKAYRAALILLATWSSVVGLEFVHQAGHLVSGCTHHEHHGQHHHEACGAWDGPHESDHLLAHQHVCEICEWMFSHLTTLVKQRQPQEAKEWAENRPVPGTHKGWCDAPFWTTTGRRGPPRG